MTRHKTNLICNRRLEQLENTAYYERLASCYPLFITDPVADTQCEMQWLSRVFSGQGIRSILDAGCGTGRHAIPLALAGFDVTASDPCRAMLREAHNGARSARKNICFIESGFEELPSALDKTFDAVIILGNSLCNLPTLGSVRRALCGIRNVCTVHTSVIVGIKDFEVILHNRPRFHDHRAAEVNGIRTILFEVWDYDDPTLICTCVRLSKSCGAEDWKADAATTREYMLSAKRLNMVCRDTGFSTPQRLAHPNEARFRLTPV